MASRILISQPGFKPVPLHWECRVLTTKPTAAAAAAKSLQSCPTLWDPIDSSPPGSPVSGILQARTLEWVAISFSNAWKWKVKVKSLSCVRLLVTPWTAAYHLLRPWDFPGKSIGVGCHCLLRPNQQGVPKMISMCAVRILLVLSLLPKQNNG